MGFEALMQRVDTVAIDRLSNATMVFGAVSGRVLFDRPSASPFEHALVAEDFEVRADRDTFPSLAHGDVVLIEGVQYTVRGEPIATADFGVVAIRVYAS